MVDINQILNILIYVFGNVISLFERVISGLGASDLLIGAFGCFVVYRILIVPIVGGALFGGASDKVSSSISRKLEESKKNE